MIDSMQSIQETYELVTGKSSVSLFGDNILQVGEEKQNKNESYRELKF